MVNVEPHGVSLHDIAWVVDAVLDVDSTSVEHQANLMVCFALSSAVDRESHVIPRVAQCEGLKFLVVVFPWSHVFFLGMSLLYHSMLHFARVSLYGRATGI